LPLRQLTEEERKAKKAYSIVKNLADLPEDYRRAAFEVILAHSLSAGPSRPAEYVAVQARPQPTLPPTEHAQTKRKLLPDRITELAPDGFFKEPKSVGEIKAELRNRGYAYSDATIGMALLSLTRRKELRRLLEKKGNKTQYLYTNP
jgi:hypothetical protein